MTDDSLDWIDDEPVRVQLPKPNGVIKRLTCPDCGGEPHEKWWDCPETQTRRNRFTGRRTSSAGYGFVIR